MFQNYFKIALRNLWRHKLHTFINLFGLAIGISACLAIFEIVKYEMSFDKFHPERDQIYRVYSEFGGTFSGFNGGVPAGLAGELVKEVTGIEVVAPFHSMYKPKVEIRSGSDWKAFKDQETVVIVSPKYFKLLSSYQWLSGSPEASLSTPHQVVLTESKTKLYFGDTAIKDIIGKEIRYTDSLLVTVSGVVKDFDRPTDFDFTDFISFSTIENSWLKDDIVLDNWDNTNSSSQLFIKKEPGAENSRIESQIATLADLHKDQEDDGNWSVAYKLQPLSDLHFGKDLGIFNHSRATANLTTLYALTGVAGILLIIACINFINLATAQALRRGREVGVRKVLGSTRGTLIAQFLGETLIVTTLAVILSVGITQLSLGFFEEFLPKGLIFKVLEPETLLFLVGLITVVSLLSGGYPAFVLSSFLPVIALKNQTASERGAWSTNWIRKGLIVVQFTISLILIAGTLIIGRQIDFFLNKDLGFDQDAIVYFYTPWQQTADKRAVLKNELSRIPNIEMISQHESPPAQNGWSSSVFKYQKNDETQELNVHRKYGDENFTKLYNIELVAGRNLMPADSLREFLVNETMTKKMGFSNAEAAIGQNIILDENVHYPIVGVVKDFHHLTLKSKIEPLAIAINNSARCFSLKLATTDKGISDLKATMDKVAAIWKNIYPDDEFNYNFFDESIAKFYEAEQRTSKLMKTATGIAIFISCIGLFGLVSFTVVQRTKEIGIRKILGASVTNIVALLSRDFVQLVLLAVLIGSPIAWKLADGWLQDFAYRIEIKWWMFALAGVVAVGVALFTVSFQAIRAATANPVESLRDE